MHLEDFAPYATLAIPLMVKVFFNSYRVRLPEFRKWHKVIFTFIVLTLIINTFFIFVNKPLYLFLSNPRKHFAYRYHVAKELSKDLKLKNINEINIHNKRLAIRLKFYGIRNGGDKILTRNKIDNKKADIIKIAYYGTIVAKYYIYKE